MLQIRNNNYLLRLEVGGFGDVFMVLCVLPFLCDLFPSGHYS